jgi:menaquinone-specific isochorismate synthase
MRLTVTTVELEGADFELISKLPENPLVYIREGHGLVGWGEALRLESRASSGRIADLAKQWKSIVENSFVTDTLVCPGSGLVAFGAFAFSDQSVAPSVLIVPRVILGSSEGKIWLTRVSNSADSQPPAAEFWLKEITYPANEPLTFHIGKTSPEKFKDLVSLAVQKIEAGQIEKVVIARDLEASIPGGFDIRASLKKLSAQYPTCWVYSVDGIFGASPELLVRVSNSQVSARVLAGTAARGTDPGVDKAISVALTSSSKNTSEHAFAVNSLVNSLKQFCAQVDADPAPFSLALPNVWHLASDVHGVLKESASVLDVAAVLHPTAAVAGTPTSAAQEVISELEQNDRGRYAGPVGWIGADGDGEWAIALRGAQIEGSHLRAFAGCGIVAESDPEAELSETELKFRPIKEAL